MEWENNYFKISGTSNSLNIKQKFSGAVAIPTDGLYYLLIKIIRSDQKEHWEFPRGFSSTNETYIQTALRELKEETNIKSDEQNSNFLGTVMPDSGLVNSLIGLVEIKTDFNQAIELQQQEKIVDYKLLTLDQLNEFVKQNIISDSFSLASILHLNYLNKK